jgi:hypothetical protein
VKNKDSYQRHPTPETQIIYKEMQRNINFAIESGDTASEVDDGGRPKRTGTINTLLLFV